MTGDRVCMAGCERGDEQIVSHCVLIMCTSGQSISSALFPTSLHSALHIP